VPTSNCTKDRPRSTPGVINPTVRTSPPAILNIREAAAYSTLSVRKLWDLIAKGELRAIRIGARTVIKLKDMDSMLEGGVR